MRLPRIRISKLLKNEKSNLVLIESDAKLTRNKAYEGNAYWNKGLLSNPLTLEFRYDRRTDHAGLHIWIHIYRFELQFDIYDHRHWDYTNDKVEECDCD